MRIRFFAASFFIVCIALLLLPSCSALARLNPKRLTQPSKRILFIGNSYTFVNGGIDKQLEGLDPSIETKSIAVGGYTLQNHWDDGNALKEIRAGKWNAVILQELSQTPVLNPGMFREFASRFDAAIKSSGARTVLLMTWQRPDSIGQGVTTANLAAAYNSLGARVAPAGLAFARSLRARPDLELYSQDGHPTLYGTFLAACVLYAAIVKNPVGNAYSDSGIDSDVGAFFQKTAADTLGF